MTSLPVLAPDCRTFPCNEECCSAGVDVWPHERERMLRDGVATASDFTGPETDDEGDVLFRTAIGPRGCTFLQPDRGCRLHGLGYKPEVCIDVPRDEEEVEELAELGMLPCSRDWKW